MLEYFGMTDIGLKRSTNQDGFYAGYIDKDTLVICVCDGMGGVAGGKEASRIALSSFSDSLRTQSQKHNKDMSQMLVHSIIKANNDVFCTAKGNKELSGMGTTLVCAVLRDDKVYFASIGDSRIYVYSKGTFAQLSHDHSYVQTLVDSGQITKEQAKVHPNRNIITKALGTNESVQPDIFVMPTEAVQKILLCSDGLCGYVEHEKIRELVCSDMSSEDCVINCISHALDAGGPDNITAAVLYI